MRSILISGGPVVTLDPTRPSVEAVFVRDGRVAATGTVAELSKLIAADDGVERLDLGGRTLVPGFNDSHFHLISSGMMASMLDLTGMGKQEILRTLQDAASRRPAGDVLFAGNWDYSSCPDPSIADLDSVFPDRPVLLVQFSSHAAWVNTSFLTRLRLHGRNSSWEGGGVLTDASGEPTGIVEEPGNCPGVAAMFKRRFRDSSSVRAGLEAALAKLAQAGITSVQDNTWFPSHLRQIRKARAAGALTARLSCWSPGFVPPLDTLFRHARFDENWAELGPRKFFIDGAFSSHTAHLLEPYEDTPETSGTGKPPEAIERFLLAASRKGIQIACHTIGDRAATSYADAGQRVAGKTGFQRFADLRHRIEHAQLVDARDIERFATLGMVVSAQPHASADVEKDRRLLGRARADAAYPIRSLLDAGVRVAFGSDFPSEPTYEPLYGMHLAVNRDSSEAITPEEALRAYTTGSAYAEFKEDEKGQIAPGFLADFAVLSGNPLQVAERSIKDIRVEMTIVDGRVVFKSGEETSAELPSDQSISLSEREQTQQGAGAHPQS